MVWTGGCCDGASDCMGSFVSRSADCVEVCVAGFCARTGDLHCGPVGLTSHFRECGTGRAHFAVRGDAIWMARVPMVSGLQTAFLWKAKTSTGCVGAVRTAGSARATAGLNPSRTNHVLPLILPDVSGPSHHIRDGAESRLVKSECEADAVVVCRSSPDTLMPCLLTRCQERSSVGAPLRPPQSSRASCVRHGTHLARQALGQVVGDRARLSARAGFGAWWRGTGDRGAGDRLSAALLRYSNPTSQAWRCW